jgi:hypothetical protein
MTIEHMKVCLRQHPNEEGVVFKMDKTDLNGNPYYRVLWADGYDSGKFLESDWSTILGDDVRGHCWLECGILTKNELLVWMIKNPDCALSKDVGDLD